MISDQNVLVLSLAIRSSYTEYCVSPKPHINMTSMAQVAKNVQQFDGFREAGTSVEVRYITE